MQESCSYEKCLPCNGKSLAKTEKYNSISQIENTMPCANIKQIKYICMNNIGSHIPDGASIFCIPMLQVFIKAQDLVILYHLPI